MKSINRACELLPIGYEINICIENGSGWISLYDSEGGGVDIENVDMDFSEQLEYAVDAALRHCRGLSYGD